MKVLQINSVCGVGSTGRIAASLHDVLIQHGHESVIAFGRGRARAVSHEDTIKIGGDLSINAHAMLSRLTDKTGFYSKHATRSFIKKVKAYNPDVVHLHNIHGYYINVELLFRYLSAEKKRVVWTLHDCWPLTGHCAYFDYVGCEKWKIGCHDCEQKSEYPKSILFDNSTLNFMKKKSLFTSVDDLTLITPSKWLSDVAKQSFLGKYPVEVINNGIDLETFAESESDFRSKHKLENRYVILGVASVWGRRKGFDAFIKLAGMLDDDYAIVLVGPDESQCIGLPENIVPISKTDSASELAEIYTMADVFVNPTLEDNFPTTNLEALACGTPVITYNTGGSVESIDETCGVVVPKNDVGGLAEAIALLRGNSPGKDACKNRAKLFDKKARYMDYIRAY